MRDDWVTIQAGTIVAVCDRCGVVTDDDVDQDNCSVGFDCGRCGLHVTGTVHDLDEPLRVHEETLADPEALHPTDDRGERAA